MKHWLMRCGLWLVLAFLCGNVSAQATTTETTSRRRIPSPLLSSTGKFSVGCATEEREDLRWPVLKFVERVVKNFDTFFVPVGSTEAPLYVSLGTSTDPKETRLTRRTLTITSTFSQLVIGIPNPEVVDLEALRVAIVEAMLREECRTRSCSYANFAWPAWFVRGMTAASFGNVWKAQAVEVLLKEYDAGTLPTLASLFNDPNITVSNETAAFFAMWLIQGRSTKERYAMITAPWTEEAFFGGPLTAANEASWRQWVQDQGDVVFIPGALTARHFERWKTLLEAPTSREQVQRITDALTRHAIGRPQLFRDLTVLYLEAYIAWLHKGDVGYQPLREKADETAFILDEHLKRNPLLMDEALTPATGQEEWQRTK